MDTIRWKTKVVNYSLLGEKDFFFQPGKGKKGDRYRPGATSWEKKGDGGEEPSLSGGKKGFWPEVSHKKELPLFS